MKQELQTYAAGVRGDPYFIVRPPPPLHPCPPFIHGPEPPSLMGKTGKATFQ